jgi:hypothetical protein
MDSPKFLLGKQFDSIDESELTQLETLVSTYKELAADIAEQEATLAETKAIFRTVSQESIPTLLNQHGLAEIKLRTGDKIIVKEDASVSVPDDKKPQFFEFLKERDEEDIIKLNIQFKKMPIEKQRDLFEFLNNYDYEYEADRGVHPMTLKSYFKKLLGVGDEARADGISKGKYLKPQDVADVANVFTFFTTKIK